MEEGAKGRTCFVEGKVRERLFDVAVASYCSGRMSDRRTRIVGL